MLHSKWWGGGIVWIVRSRKKTSCLSWFCDSDSSHFFSVWLLVLSIQELHSQAAAKSWNHASILYIHIFSVSYIVLGLVVFHCASPCVGQQMSPSDQNIFPNALKYQQTIQQNEVLNGRETHKAYWNRKAQWEQKDGHCDQICLYKNDYLQRHPFRKLSHKSVCTNSITYMASNSWNSKWTSSLYRGHYITNPNNALLQGKSLKITINVYCLIPPKMGNLITPVIDVSNLLKLQSYMKATS